MRNVLLSEDEIRRLIADELAKALSIIPRTVQASDSGGWLSERAAQKYLGGVSRSTLYRWRRDGLIPYTVTGRRVLYRRDDLDAVLAGGDN